MQDEEQTHIYVCARVCTHKYLHTNTYILTLASTHITNANAQTHTHSYTQRHTDTDTHTHTDAETHTQTHGHTHIHTLCIYNKVG